MSHNHLWNVCWDDIPMCVHRHTLRATLMPKSCSHPAAMLTGRQRRRSASHGLNLRHLEEPGKPGALCSLLASPGIRHSWWSLVFRKTGNSSFIFQTDRKSEKVVWFYLALKCYSWKDSGTASSGSSLFHSHWKNEASILSGLSFSFVLQSPKLRFAKSFLHNFVFWKIITKISSKIRRT